MSVRSRARGARACALVGGAWPTGSLFFFEVARLASGGAGGGRVGGGHEAARRDLELDRPRLVRGGVGVHGRERREGERAHRAHDQDQRRLADAHDPPRLEGPRAVDPLVAEQRAGRAPEVLHEPPAARVEHLAVDRVELRIGQRQAGAAADDERHGVVEDDDVALVRAREDDELGGGGGGGGRDGARDEAVRGHEAIVACRASSAGPRAPRS